MTGVHLNGSIKMDRRTFVIGTAATVAAGPAFAQETYPSRAITIINAFPPGGANDLVTRPLAAAMEPILKQPVLIETKAGAGGQLGAQVGASAKPDGYTLLSHNTGISGYAEVDKLFDRPPKATRADFITLARLVADPIVLLVNDQQPYKTLKDFVDDARSSAPDTVLFSSGGLYGATHLPMALLASAAGGLRTSSPAYQWRRPGHNRHSRQQRAGDRTDGLGFAHPYQVRQVAAAGAVRRRAFESAARRADAEGARLPRRILFVGWDIRPERHAAAGRNHSAQRNRHGRPQPAVHGHARQSRARSRLSRWPDFGTFWDDDIKRIGEAVRAIGRVQG